jgi:hypothetical protein
MFLTERENWCRRRVAEDMLRPGHCSEGKGKTGLRSMERASGGGGLR